jgi:hypothetical protein
MVDHARPRLSEKGKEKDEECGRGAGREKETLWVGREEGGVRNQGQEEASKKNGETH